MDKKVRKFIRNVPVEQLKPFLLSSPISIPEDFVWRGKGNDYAKALTEAVLDTEDRKFIDIIERIHDIAEDLGQTALFATIGENEEFLQQKSSMARSLWAFQNAEKRFQEAEQYMYLDARRNTRQWSGYCGPKDKPIDQQPSQRNIFKEALSKYIKGGRRFKLEFFHRTRTDHEGKSVTLVQLMILQEGIQQSFDVFEEDGDNVETTYLRPVEEIALTYQPETGVIEVVSPKQDTRAVLAKAFMKAFLGHDVDDPATVPLKEYNLDLLKTPQNFMDNVDAHDNIEDIRVTLIRLKPYDEKNFVTVEAAYGDTKRRSVYELSEEWFSQNDPIKKSFSVKQARIAVKFRSDDRFPRGKQINVMISYPNGCNLNEQTEHEKLICQKYLNRWGLVKEI